MEEIEGLTEEVERELAGLSRAEVPSSLIGQMVMERLRRLDHVAYVRFASVYRNFQDAESFTQEVEALLETGPSAPKSPGLSTELQAQFSLPFNGETPQTRRRGRPRRGLGTNQGVLNPLQGEATGESHGEADG